MINETVKKAKEFANKIGNNLVTAVLRLLLLFLYT